MRPLTWVFSGLLSVQPFAWMTMRGLHVPADVLSGGPLRLADFPAFEPAAWAAATAGRTVKEVGLRRIDRAPYYDVRLAGPGGHEQRLLAARTLAPRRAADVDTLVARLSAAVTDAEVIDATRLTAYDAYCYGRGSDGPPLPVVRMRFADPLATWLDIDPATARIVQAVHPGDGRRSGPGRC